MIKEYELTRDRYFYSEDGYYHNDKEYYNRMQICKDFIRKRFPDLKQKKEIKFRISTRRHKGSIPIRMKDNGFMKMKWTASNKASCVGELVRSAEGVAREFRLSLKKKEGEVFTVHVSVK